MTIHKLIFPDGTVLSSGTAGSAIRAVTVTESVNDGTELTPGSAVAATMEVSLYAPEGLPIAAGDEVKLLRQFADGTEKTVGIFRVETPVRTGLTGWLLTGFDRMILLDRDLTGWLSSLTGWPYPLERLAQMVCDACGVTLATGDMPNALLPIGKLSRNGVTGRQLIRWLAELSCRFCRIDPAGRLRFDWYAHGGDTLTPTGENWYFQLTQSGYAVQPVDAAVTGLDVQGGNPYVFAGNPMVSSLTQEALETFLAQLQPVTYTPCRVTVPIDREISPGTLVEIQTPTGETVTGCVMSRTVTGQQAVLEGTGSAYRNSAAARNNPASLEQLAQSRVDAQTQQDVFLKLTHGGTAPGLFLEDGQLYINASFVKAGTLDASLVQVINLIADHLRSVSDASVADVSGAKLTMSYDRQTTVSLNNQGGADPILYLQSWEDGGRKNQSELTAHHLKLGGTSAEPTFQLQTLSGAPELSLADGIPRRLSWKPNGDGTFTLIGTL